MKPKHLNLNKVVILKPILTMKNQVAFKMKLKPNCKDEYKKRHDEIWPELTELLKKAGIFDYSIFLDEETNILFAIQHSKETTRDLTHETVMKKWWSFMADIMETNTDQSPVVSELPLMFYMA